MTIMLNTPATVRPAPAVFSGDWHMGDGDTPYDVGFAGILLRRWNGWAVPYVHHRVLTQIVDAQAKLVLAEGADVVDQWAMEGTTLVITHCQPPNEQTRVQPDAEGGYLLDVGYCYDVVEAGECATVWR